ncbi:MAG: hypothetical protein EP297_04980 [Gammaproteobacteria bacterium]|nr:MAG: hypothetical protein EP297_04980 [Gammaproteobacteria bacterium]
MKKPTYIEGVVAALIISATVIGLLAVLDWIIPISLLLRVLISMSTIVYVLYLFSRSKERIGRITAITIILITSIASWITGLPVLIYMTIHLGLIWFVRSLYFYSSVLSALADLGLTGLGFAAGVAAYLHTDSVFLALWSLFLVQAMFVWIPPSMKRGSETISQAEKHDRFRHAQRLAEQALNKMAAQS